ncbi:uncharacterized protein [Centruroides vittatus]|uniref:uncharacterized protein n=1 Tax=Centruroides vittatus TaxID=120091 RepID=UPI00350FC7D3
MAEQEPNTRKSKSGTCFVPLCKTGYRSCKEKKSLFLAPKDDNRRKDWEKLIRRSDLTLEPWHRVCELHFEEHFIIRNWKHIVKGEEVIIPRDVPILSVDAVPTKFEGYPKYYSNVSLPRKRSNRNLSNNTNKKKKVNPPLLSSEELDIQPELSSASSSFSSLQLKDFEKLKVPDFWIRCPLKNESNLIVYAENKLKLEDNHASLNALKLITFAQYEDVFSCKVYIKGVQFENISPISSLQQAEDIIENTDKLKICNGAATETELESNILFGFKNMKNLFGCIYSSKCLVIANNGKSCIPCKYTRHLLINRKSRQRKTKVKTSKTVRKPQHTYRALNKINSRLRRKVNNLQSVITQIHTSNNKIQQSTLEEKIKSLPAKEQLAVKHCFLASKRKSNRGLPYDPEWILECIIMRMKSPRLYEHLRINKILALPCHNTLQKYMRSFKSGFGFNPKIFDALKEKVKELDEFQKHGGLLVDELKLSESYHITSSGLIEGFVDLGDFTPEQMKTTPCDHGMVIMYQPLTGDWQQILGVFATRGNISGELLSKLLLEAIALVERSGLMVDFITCDGASWNRNMWAQFGIGYKPVGKKISCKVTHPVDSKRNLHFISDFPHLIKCLRNNLLKCPFKTPEGEVCIEHMKEAWKLDDTPETLKFMPHVFSYVINPNNYEKMRVNYAFRLFSDEMLKGLYAYQDKIEQGFGSISATQNFVKQISDLINIMTSRVPSNGLRLDSR